MTKLEPPDSHHLMAAIGWLELGNPQEAAAELRGVQKAGLCQPEILELWWDIHAGQQHWEDALAAAQTLLQKHPERSSGWIHQAYALRRVPNGSLERARAALLPAWRQFPKEEIIPFNLACYAAQMGHHQEAIEWLQRAMAAAGDEAAIKRRALQDEDLMPVWDTIKKM